jgi:hypothetical protein
MKLSIAILAAALTASAAPVPVTAPQAAPELAGRTPGKAQRCVTGEAGLLFQVSESDPHLLLYGDGKTIWASRLGPECGFEAGETAMPDETASFYCRGDFVRAGGRVTLIPGRRCTLGDFTPYKN